MANIGKWTGDRIEIDMTGTSEEFVMVEFGQKLKKDIPNSVQIIGIDVDGSGGKAGLRLTLLGGDNGYFAPDYFDLLGEEVDITSNFSETFQTPYAYNSVFVYLDNTQNVTGGRILIVLNKD